MDAVLVGSNLNTFVVSKIVSLERVRVHACLFACDFSLLKNKGNT
jgi:hypothetical protein